MKESLRLLLLVAIAYAVYRLWKTLSGSAKRDLAREDAEAIARWETLKRGGFLKHLLWCDYTRFFVLFYAGSAMAHSWRRTGSVVPSAEIALQFGVLGLLLAVSTSTIQWRDLRTRADEARRRRRG